MKPSKKIGYWGLEIRKQINNEIHRPKAVDFVFLVKTKLVTGILSVVQHYVKQTQTGLAAIALAQGNLAEAMAPMDDILDYLATHILSTIDEAAWIYLTCYRILQAADDPRAQPTLEAAYNFIQDIAMRMDDARLRASFLQNVRFNREIVAAWEGRGVP